ncbi:Alanine-phosphoribitol ligase [Balamuthia mandrillaris]
MAKTRLVFASLLLLLAVLTAGVSAHRAKVDDILRNYDFIVLGGGTAGCAVAARLAENPHHSVLLVERGEDRSDDPTVAVPTMNSVVPSVPLEVLPVEHFHTIETLLARQQTPTVVPRALGGGPAVSGSFWGRGGPQTYNEWAELVGDDSLRYEELLPFFKKSERVKSEDSSSSDRGRDGPIDVVFLDPNDTAVAPFAEKQAEIFGIEQGRDYSTSAGQVGIWPMQRSLTWDGVCSATGPCQRQTTYTEYIKNGPSRPNLDVLPKATALKLIYGRRRPGENAKVMGVRVLVDGTTLLEIRAKKEVIVSLGPVNSPKFLMLSGIGDPSDLTPHGIEPVVSLPGVGQNLQDHAVFRFAFVVPSAPSLTLPSAVRVAFLASGHHEDFVDIEIAWTLFPNNLLVGFVVQVRGAQVGEIKLRTSEPTDRVDMKLNLDVDNLDPMIWAFRKVREWMAEFPGAVEITPGVAALPADVTDAQFRTWLSSNVEAWYHMVGTCKMGANNDEQAVVDSEFRVFGVDNLRVVDCSVMPVVVPTHPSASATMLAERCAALIKEEYAN